jgi:hypothetical protein
MTVTARSTKALAGEAERGLFIVHVRERANRALTGHDGCEYISPPQPRADALALVALLLGCPAPPGDGHSSWTHAIAGVQRTVTLVAPPALGPAEGNGDPHAAA